MPTARKEAAVGELAEKLAGAKNLFLTDYAGLTVDEITRLRGELRKDGNTYSVVKNTLFRIAAGDLAAQLESFLRVRPASSSPGQIPSRPPKRSRPSATPSNASPSRPRTSTARSSMQRRSRSSRSFRPRSNSSQISSVRSPIRFAGSSPCSPGISAVSCACSTRFASKKPAQLQTLNKDNDASWQLPNSSNKSINSPCSSLRISSSSSRRNMASPRPHRSQ